MSPLENSTHEPAGGSAQRSLEPVVESASRIDARQFLRLLNRRKWRLIGTTILVLATTCLNAGVVRAQVDVRRNAKYGYGDYGYYYWHDKYGPYYLE